MTSPAPGNGQAAQVSTTVYDNLGRAKQVTAPDATITYHEYFPTGLRKKTYGGRGYPVEYTYDAQGQTKTMKTWTNYASGTGAAITTWNYDAYRGWLASKRDANSQGCDYTYTAAGRLSTRTWARGSPRISTTYTYNNAGEQTLADYSDSTPDLTCSYDRRGRQVICVRNSITTTRDFHDAGHLLGESYSGGTLAGLALTDTYDSYFRRTQVIAKNGTTTLATSNYGYDNASRLSSASDGTYSANYTYVANSPQVGQIDFKQNTTLRMSTVKNYDYLNRLSSIASHPGGAPSLASLNYAYQYNDAN